MFYPHFKSIKDRLADQVTAIKNIQWFNEQYGAPALSECLAFIEFPDSVRITQTSKLSSRGEYTVCIHILSKIISDNDGYISDSQIAAHDAVSDAVESALNFYQLTYLDVALGRPLQAVSFQVQHMARGWLVTKIFFTTKQVQ